MIEMFNCSGTKTKENADLDTVQRDSFPRILMQEPLQEVDDQITFSRVSFLRLYLVTSAHYELILTHQFEHIPVIFFDLRVDHPLMVSAER